MAISTYTYWRWSYNFLIYKTLQCTMDSVDVHSLGSAAAQGGQDTSSEHASGSPFTGWGLDVQASICVNARPYAQRAVAVGVRRIRIRSGDGLATEQHRVRYRSIGIVTTN